MAARKASPKGGRKPKAVAPEPALTPELLERVARALTRAEAMAPGAPARPARPAASRGMLATQVQPPPAAPRTEAAALREMPFTIATSMDPRLQLAIANRRGGKRGFALASAEPDEQPVIARVTSPEAWAALPDTRPGAVLGKAEDGSFVVTGRVPIARLEAVHASKDVLSLKASQLVRPQLAATIAVMGVAPAALPQGAAPGGGAGVVVGIVDFGGDFAHRNFRRSDGSTRLLALWDQAGVARANSPFGYGRLHSREEIDAALATDAPYATLGYAPPPDSSNQRGAHGTHVMDIAAGNGGGTNQAGVAPEADIVFVEASITDIAGPGPGVVGSAFGDSVQLLEAVRFIFDLAKGRPCVVNLSLGTNGGPHDASSLVEQGLDAMLAEAPNRAVVIAASNSQDDGIHTSGQVSGAGKHDILWHQSGRGGGEVELWYPGARRLRLSLVAPDGTVFGPVAPGGNLPIGAGGRISIFLGNRLNDPNNHDNVVNIWVAENLSEGDWTLRLESDDGQPVDYHAWIERDDFAQASFDAPVPTHTLGSISTGRNTIVVGSYDAHNPVFPLSFFSSSGPTRDGREKPELSAPGQAVVAARSRTGDGVTTKSGTSMAAPAVTGLVALILAEAARNGRDLDIETLRVRLVSSALRDPPAGAAWDPRYGHGRASGASIVEGVA